MISLSQQVVEDQQECPLFVCAECGEPVIVFNGNQFKTCEHFEPQVNPTPLGIKAASGI